LQYFDLATFTYEIEGKPAVEDITEAKESIYTDHYMEEMN
jgi:hypothetical protein